MIELQKATVGYHKGEEILHGVSLEFEKGKISVLVGPNGSGKSTLLKASCGMLPLTGGKVLVQGKDIQEISHKQLAQRVAYLPQSRDIPSITVGRIVLHGRFPYLGYPRRYTKEDKEIAYQAMEWVGVQGLSDREMSQLSGGQRQKAYLAMALAQDTGAIFLDEPTTYLDISCQLEMMELIRRLRDGGKTVVMVLHDLDMAFRYGDVIFLMEAGRIVQTGKPEQIFASGLAEQVFQVNIGCFHLPEGGIRYYFY